MFTILLQKSFCDLKDNRKILLMFIAGKLCSSESPGTKNGSLQFLEQNRDSRCFFDDPAMMSKVEKHINAVQDELIGDLILNDMSKTSSFLGTAFKWISTCVHRYWGILIKKRFMQ